MVAVLSGVMIKEKGLIVQPLEVVGWPSSKTLLAMFPVGIHGTWKLE
jgi:hypothetical protein